MCPAGDTCQIDCTKGKGECTPGGTGGPGAPCTTNMDCAPGSQCFDYSATGCGVKICLRFCNEDSQCPASGSTDGGAASDGGADSSGVPTKSVCQGVVPCGTVATAYHTCTFGCDPRAAAITANATRCPTGLSCLVVGNMDQVDCACPEATRKGTDGADCAAGADCAPGFICNMMGGTQKCRAICRCDATQGMTCTPPDDCTGGKGCTALTNETTFGVCL
jgi:hypothetical protein